MRLFIVGLTIATITLAALLLVRVYKSNVAREPNAVNAAVTQTSQSADTLQTLEKRVARDVKRDRWWMLLVGLTVVAYRLRQKHRSLFENSLLYISHEDFVMRTPALPSEFEEVTQRVVEAT
jgi:hypothetical protein